MAFRNKQGTKTEVQIHTRASYKAKTWNHPLYVKQRKLPEDSLEWKRLEKEQAAIWKSVPQVPWENLPGKVIE